MKSRLISLCMAPVVLMSLAACRGRDGAGGAAGPITPHQADQSEVLGMSVSLTSSAFGPNEKIPLRYSPDGENLSPPVAWSGLPSGARELALICDDPDAPGAAPFVHWVIYGLDAAVKELPEGIPPQKELTEPLRARQGVNGWGKIGWGGPAPPRGAGPHHYNFTLLAFSRPLALPAGASKEALLKAGEGAVVAKVTLIGIYER